jgi:hypothetical protein
VKEIVYLRNGSVKHGYPVAMVVHVKNQVLAHHGQTNQANIAISLLHKFS